GNKIGEGKEDTAAEYANIFSMFAIISGIVLGIALYFSSPVISNLFDVSEATRQNIYNILIVLSVFMVVNMYSLVLIIGVLRGGGDTKFSFYLEFSCVWLVGVPLAFMGVLLFKLPIYWVVALVSIEEVVKSVIGYFRIRTGKWIRNVVQDMS
ncbi:MAG TPA: MATE family efflux transporter, partial [Clostridiales bacterium]|nr:MATE family efflux transporter [Clostridiales bacterium]